MIAERGLSMVHTMIMGRVHHYAQFLSQTGTLKNRPGAWTELFLPNLKDRQGS
jgi:hypothetical protein